MKTWKRISRLPFRATEVSARGARPRLVGGLRIHACRRSAWPAAVEHRRIGHSLPHPDPAEPVPGIAHTPRTDSSGHLACVARTGRPRRPDSAAVSDPAAPRITITVPRGWTVHPRHRGHGLDVEWSRLPVLDGDHRRDRPDARERLPALHRRVGGTMPPRLKFSVTGSPFCGYSSQQLTGTLQGPSGGIDFADRHHPHLDQHQAVPGDHPRGGARRHPGFKEARSALTQDFAVVIP